MDDRLQYTSRRVRGALHEFHVLELVGKIDSGNAHAVESEIMRLAKARVHLVVDCSGVLFVASSGMRAFIVGAQLSQRSKCIFRVAGLIPVVDDVFKVTGLHRIIDIRPTVDDALAAASSVSA